MKTGEQERGAVRVLLIEDNEDDAIMIRDMIAQMSQPRYDLHWVSNLHDGNAKIQEWRPEVILLDLSLPDSKDAEGVESVQSNQPGEITIVVLTGHDDQTKAAAAIQKGAEDYLIKGQINVILLERALRNSMERKKVKMELALANATLKELVGQDPLTGVLNRRGFQEVLGIISAERKRVGLDIYALLLDLDDFKSLNDRYGYGVGDMALKVVSKTIRHIVRASDYIARVGGDEFIILLVNTRAEEALLVADKVCQAVSKDRIFVDSGQPIMLTCSIGVAPFDENCEILEGLFRALEKSLQRSKVMGKNRITVRDGSDHRDVKTLLEVSDVASTLFKDENFYALYQPIYDLRNRTEIAVEMLIRIRHDTIQTLGDLFLLARHHKLLTWVDFQCFKTCLKTASALSPNLRIHVNLFPSTLMTLKADRFKDEVALAGGEGRVCVELSEQQIVGDPSHLLAEVNKLKKHGIQIAIDDVGFGYSSLESLVILEPDLVKIDICAIRGIAADKTKQNQFRRMVKVIEVCEAKYIVEGLENEADLDFLLQSGTQYGQGFLFGQPKAL